GYEVALEVMNTSKPNTVGIVVPIGRAQCLLTAGGWDGGIAGLTTVDDRWGNDNPTTHRMQFPRDEWYRVRLRVTERKVQAWVGAAKVFDIARAGHVFALPTDRDPLRPFGIETWAQSAKVRNIVMRRVQQPDEAGPDAPPDGERLYKAVVAVVGRARWLDTGLWVEDGARYRLAAEGKWGFDPLHTCGPDGAVQEPAPDTFPLPGKPSHTLIGRVGLEGRPFAIGQSLSWFAGSTGRLFLMMNDPKPLDNWGSLRVRVEGPLLAADNARLLSWFTRELTSLDVSAKAAAESCGVDVKKGDLLLITAEGNWSAGAGACDANGVDTAFAAGRRGILTGRVGEAGATHPLGALSVIEADAAGKLYLAMNDDDRANNTGSVRVTVRAFERPGPPKLPEEPGVWASLFNGRSLHGWRVVSGAGFAGRRRVRVEPGRIVLQLPPERAGLAWTGEFPSCDYELSLEVMREDGAELCELLFPVGSERCGWNIGGWGGAQTGLSMVDGVGGDRNDTNGKMACRDRQWYRLRLRVTAAKVEGWRDGEKCIDLSRAGRTFTQPSWLPIPEPFALTTWRTTLAIRNIRVQRLESEPEEPPADGVQAEEAAVAVSAREGWQDTGLTLTKGKRYTLSAAGRWGENEVSSRGPEGLPRGEFRAYALFGKRVLDLVARLGPQGRPFSIAGRLELTAAQSGRLFLRMNDDDHANNWGSLRAAIRGPMLADKDAPLLSRFAKTVAKVQVLPGGGWVSSGIELRRGDRVLLSAKGSWRQRAGQPPIGPNGLDRSFKHLRAGALLGRVGPHGARFVVGELHRLEAAEDGKLYLAINDIATARLNRPMGRLRRLGGRLEVRAAPPAGKPVWLGLVDWTFRGLWEAQRQAQAPKARQKAAADAAP
ncbi:DUF1080 domain-containing protein, partial [bacterium]|nr:DUF1080 domain-containing protein [bacterium]